MKAKASAWRSGQQRNKAISEKSKGGNGDQRENISRILKARNGIESAAAESRNERKVAAWRRGEGESETGESGGIMVT